MKNSKDDNNNKEDEKHSRRTEVHEKQSRGGCYTPTRQRRAPLTSRISNAILLLKSVTEPVPPPLSVTTAEEGIKPMEPLTDGAEEEGPKSTAAADRC
uniref:Uncharacterized protein n=1 Tax=Globodera pallida TaxID=36090 RepID=A0A183C313_GLOPA